MSFNLQDYLVLLPSAYYEAPILQMQVTEPCSYTSGTNSIHRYTYKPQIPMKLGHSVIYKSFLICTQLNTLNTQLKYLLILNLILATWFSKIGAGVCLPLCYITFPSNNIK